MEMPNAAIFAVGSMTQPQVIVSAMRAGAREYIERPTTTTALLEAFVRLTAAQRKARGESGRRGKVFTMVNAKGGTGATTVAVNTALTLQASHGNVALVDLAPLGHAALHLNVKPLFTIADALRNLHRMDASLLESFMTREPSGLHLLAGTSAPTSIEPSTSEFAALFDMLVSHYRYTVVDASTRLDPATRLVCNLSEMVLLVAHTDVASLWSAARVMQYLGESGGRERVRLVLNRFRKIPGFNEDDAESATGAKLLWKIPNHYVAVSNSIDRGVPVIQQNHSEVARSFSGLAAAITEADEAGKRVSWSLFKTV
jgi:pilus assembly protein CpaE